MSGETLLLTDSLNDDEGEYDDSRTSNDWIPIDDDGNPINPITKSADLPIIAADDVGASQEDKDDFDPDYEEALRDREWKKESQQVFDQMRRETEQRFEDAIKDGRFSKACQRNRPVTPPSLLTPPPPPQLYDNTSVFSNLVTETLMNNDSPLPSSAPPSSKPLDDQEKTKFVLESFEINRIYNEVFESMVDDVRDWICYAVFCYLIGMRLLCYKKPIYHSPTSAKLILSSVALAYSSLIMFIGALMLMIPFAYVSYTTPLTNLFDLSFVLSPNTLWWCIWLMFWLFVLWLNRVITCGFLKLVWVNGAKIEHQYTQQFGELCAGVTFIHDFIDKTK